MLHLISRKNRGGETRSTLVGAKLFTWGRNELGVGMRGTTSNISSPEQVGSLTDWAVFTTSSKYNSFAIKTNGTMWGCGDNTFGGVGNSASGANVSSPVQIGSATNWVTLGQSNSAGFGGHGAAVNSDGKAYCWGKGQFGRLGLGNTTAYSSPAQLGSLTDWSRILKLQQTTMAVKSDGTLWALGGKNQHGQCATGDTTERSSPVQVGSLTDWLNAEFAIGQEVMLVVKTDGTLWAWGQNDQGQMGQGNTTSLSSPTQIGSKTDWKHPFTAYGKSNFAVNTSGKLYAWGKNNLGFLGLGNTTAYSSPVQVGSLTDWEDGGCFYTPQAVKSDHTVWTWGPGDTGWRGTGSTATTSSPEQVGSLTSWINMDFTRGGIGMARQNA
jgi:alpha-tubulin suppressor-like RCC1 family protein